MSKDRLALIVVILGLSVITYLAWVVDSYKPVTNNVIPSEYSPEKVTNKDLEKYGPVLPELSDEENAATDSLFKSYVKESEEKSERKSIENIREDVIKILETETTDDTVTISFNMQWTPYWVE